MIVRSYQNGSSLGKFDEFFDAMQADAATFEPPIELDREDVEIVQYGGEMYRGTFGMEVNIPTGHIIPDTYTRVRTAQNTI